MTLKIRTKKFYHRVKQPKDADRNLNIADLDQTESHYALLAQTYMYLPSEEQLKHIFDRVDYCRPK